MDFEVPMSHIRATWSAFQGGQWWLTWQSYTSFYREVVGMKLEGDLWERDKAYTDAQSNNGWWWPHLAFVVVTDRPSEVKLEAVGEYTYQFHCADGPCAVWPDGLEMYAWHGTQVPEGLIMGKWSPSDILREPNAEVRRCAIEHMGWPEFVVKAGLKQVGKAMPDPGNPGYELELYDVPEQIYEQPVRVLLCTNATPERDGTRRRFGLTVPAEVETALAAAAWLAGVDEKFYSKLKYAC